MAINSKPVQEVGAPNSVPSQGTGDVQAPNSPTAEIVGQVGAPNEPTSQGTGDVQAPNNLTAEAVGQVGPPNNPTAQTAGEVLPPNDPVAKPVKPILRTLTPLLNADFASQSYAQGLNNGLFEDIFTYSRASTATFINRQLNNLNQWEYFVDTAAIDEPRFAYDPETGEALGIQLEGASTNLQTWSDDFSQSDWAKSLGTTVGSTVQAPDLTSQAQLLVAGGTTSAKQINQPHNVTSGAAVTTSVYAKAGGFGVLQINYAETYFTDLPYANFDLNEGVVSVEFNCIAKIEPLLNGWYRCIVTATPDNTGLCDVNYLIQDDPNASRFGSITGDGVKGVYLWRGSSGIRPFETSSIKTEGVAATRVADSLTCGGENSANVDENMTWYATFNTLDIGFSENRRIWGMDDFDFFYASLTTNGGFTQNNGGTVSTPSGSANKGFVAYTQDVTVPIRTAYKNDKKATTPSTTYAGKNQPLPQIIVLGNSAHTISPAEAWYGHIAKFQTYNLALTEDEVKNL